MEGRVRGVSYSNDPRSTTHSPIHLSYHIISYHIRKKTGTSVAGIGWTGIISVMEWDRMGGEQMGGEPKNRMRRDGRACWPFLNSGLFPCVPRFGRTLHVGGRVWRIRDGDTYRTRTSGRNTYHEINGRMDTASLSCSRGLLT